MNIPGINSKIVTDRNQSPKKDTPVENKVKGIEQFSSDACRASLAYGRAQVSVNKTSKVEEQSIQKPRQGTINLFYFSDTHGELAGLSKLASAKEACMEYCRGQLTVLGAGDLIAGKQSNVIAATVNVVNKMGMEATAIGNHEKSRSDESLKQIADDLEPEFLAINSTQTEKEKFSILPSVVCKQGEQEFITVGLQLLSPVDNPVEIAKSVDTEVLRIKQERKSQGLSDNLPVVLLSHMGSNADKTVAENSETVNLILGGHTHHVENYTYNSKNGRSVQVLQCGANNYHAAIIKMDIDEDGKVSTSAKMLNLNDNVEEMCADLETFYDTQDVTKEAIEKAQKAEKETEKTVAGYVGAKRNIAEVPEGYGYNTDNRERNYSNPVANIMADAFLNAVKDKGVNVAFIHAPTVKDTAVPDNKMLTNYDILGRMSPFGGEICTAEISVEKLYQVFEEKAQNIHTYGSELMQCSGMTYSVNVDKAEKRHDAKIKVVFAEKELQEANNSGDKKAISEAETKLAEARNNYNSLPGCVEKILILNPDGTETKINPKAIARGDFDGQTIKVATSDFLANEFLSENTFENTYIDINSVFEQELNKIKDDYGNVFFTDQNDVRIAIKDPKGLINGYSLDTGLNTKYWY